MQTLIYMCVFLTKLWIPSGHRIWYSIKENSIKSHSLAYKLDPIYVYRMKKWIAKKKKKKNPTAKNKRELINREKYFQQIQKEMITTP